MALAPAYFDALPRELLPPAATDRPAASIIYHVFVNGLEVMYIQNQKNQSLGFNASSLWSWICQNG
jgi:hypothetical protein